MDDKVTEKLSFLEARVEHIAAQVKALTMKVESLTNKADLYPAGTAMNGSAARDNEFPDASEALLSWVGRSSLLQRLSTICFLLVVALVLRTITDSGIINRQLGSVIGMSYAAALMVMGWFRYGRANPLAPVFAVRTEVQLTHQVLQPAPGSIFPAVSECHSLKVSSGEVTHEPSPMSIVHDQFIHLGSVSFLAADAGPPRV